jgi:hypothetical protein
MYNKTLDTNLTVTYNEDTNNEQGQQHVHHTSEV